MTIIALLLGLKVMFWTPKGAVYLKANHWTCIKPPFPIKMHLFDGKKAILRPKKGLVFKLMP